MHDVTRAHVFDRRVGGQAILRQPDAIPSQIAADALVLFGIEAVPFEQRGQRVFTVDRTRGRQQTPEQQRTDALGTGTAQMQQGEGVELSSPELGKGA